MTLPCHCCCLLYYTCYLQEKIEPPVYVSDRRLVKAVALMQVSGCNRIHSKLCTGMLVGPIQASYAASSYCGVAGPCWVS